MVPTKNVIARYMRRILTRRCNGLVRYLYVAPVMSNVYADGPIDQDEMAWFSSQNCFVSMNRLGTGEGPGESIVLPLVDWSKMKIVKGWSEGSRTDGGQAQMVLCLAHSSVG